MDTATLTTILTFGSGILAGLLPKILDYFFEGKKSQLQTKRFYFEKKIEVLQSYVATCTQLSASSFHSAIIIRELKKNKFFGDDDTFRDVVIQNLSEAETNGKVMVQQLAPISSAASMFIDSKIDHPEAYKLLRLIHTESARIGEFIENVDRVINDYNLKYEPATGTAIGDEYDAAKRQYANHLEKIALNYEAIKDMMNNAIIEVRKDVKKLKV